MVLPVLTSHDIDSGVSAAVSVHPGARFPKVVLLCEHGGKIVPPAWNGLGIPAPFYETHFGADIGAAELAKRVAANIGATAIISNYSRLFLDYNRHSSDPDCFKLDMGGIPIPGNLGLSAEEVLLREQFARTPLERTIDEWTLRDTDGPSLLISFHSFSPVWANTFRSCEIGVMWREDTRLAPKLIERLSESGGFKIEDNQPYDFRTSDWFTLKRHGLDLNVPCAYIEVRNTFLIDARTQLHIADLIANAVSAIIEEM